MKAKKKKKKAGIHHRIHRHIKKHLSKLKKKRPRVHKAVVLMSITMPIVLGALLFGSSALYYYESYFDNTDYSKEKITVNLPTVPDDTVNWKTYQDSETKFSVKYPDRWDDPEVTSQGKSGTKYLRKISFDNGLESHDKSYKGFEVFVYDSEKFPSPVNTDSLIAKNSGTFQTDNCDKAEFLEASIGEGGYPAQEVDIWNDNKCFQEAYFFSVTKGGYTYNIVPKIGNIENPIGGGMKPGIISAFPKFFEITSTIVLPEEEKKIVEEDDKPAVVKKAPPRRVLKSMGSCRHKNDKPRKSKTKKHRHMDEDCCMDPDEWPNPRCQY